MNHNMNNGSNPHQFFTKLKQIIKCYVKMSIFNIHEYVTDVKDNN